MSLMDALLLESLPLKKTDTELLTNPDCPWWWCSLMSGPVTRSVVFVTLRKDGVSGCGMADDPYNGSTVHYPALSILSISATGEEVMPSNPSYPSRKKYTVATSVNHGYANGDFVTISGVNDPNGQPSAYYNGTFIVDSVTNDTFKYIIATPPASANLNGSPTCSKVVFGLDTVLRALPSHRQCALG